MTSSHPYTLFGQACSKNRLWVYWILGHKESFTCLVTCLPSQWLTGCFIGHSIPGSAKNHYNVKSYLYIHLLAPEPLSGSEGGLGRGSLGWSVQVLLMKLLQTT